ncbi:MAG: TonB-dependent receptor [Muribaculaceae bacterium]|nr:TonB-dependent receptor [Muribaculaceae bacterium]
MKLRPIFIIIAFAIFALSVSAKIVISGHVVNDDNQPLDLATTLILDEEGNMLYFQLTDDEGYFEYEIDSLPANALLTVESLGYDSYRLNPPADKDTKNLKIMLKAGATELKEVVVTAPEVVLRGDTLSYQLSAFAGKGDVTLKDAMRNLPGIDIADNGKIKYLGKDISNFYIEGLDLLGGRYNVAADNLPVSAVTNVEILNNHQSVKMDKDVFSDNVAINIRLNSKAKFKPVGSYEGVVGYGDGWRYQLSGAGMMFNNKFQSILTGKYGNVVEFAENANLDHYSGSDMPYSASDLLGDLGLATPPLSRDRYINPTDCYVSLNTIGKLGNDATIRANAGYSYTHTSYAYTSLKDYFSDNGGVVSINQAQSSESRIHRPNLSLEYKLNSAERYLTNTLTGNVGVRDIDLPSILNNALFEQNERIRDVAVRNDFSSSWRHRALKWNLSSRLEYVATPEGSVAVTDDNSGVSFLQSAKSRTLSAKTTLSGAYEYRRSRIMMPLSVLYSNNKIESSLDWPSAYNDAIDNNVSVWFAPQYEYTHPMRKFVLRASANFKWDYNHVDNRGSSPVKESIGRFSVSPTAYLYWQITPSSGLRGQVSYLNTTGDISDFLTAPVRTDNLMISCKSGILSEQRAFDALLHYDFKLPLELWFLNADLIYDNTRSNLIANSNISDSSLEVSIIPMPDRQESVSGMLSLTKLCRSINTKFTVGGAYMWGRNTVAQDEIIHRQYGRSYSVRAGIISRPVSMLEFDYDGNLAASHMSFGDTRNRLLSQKHSFKLNVFPIDGLQVDVGADLIRKDITENVARTIGLLDIGISYKFLYYRIGLNLNNILNTRHYAYTIFSGINQFTYDYSLRGRELLLTFSFTR